jgi:hypothetical protein
MTAALRLGFQIFIRPAGGDRLLPDWQFWLRTDQVASILRHLNLRTTVWSSYTSAQLQLEDISNRSDIPFDNQAYFKAEDLRSVLTNSSDTLHVVNYRSHFTVVEIKGTPADLDNTLLELETGLVL